MHTKKTAKELEEFWDKEIERMEKEITEITKAMYVLIEAVENVSEEG